MQNWLAGEEPDLFFGSPPATPARSAAPGGEPFGKIVFAQRLEVGDLVHVLQADGVSVHAPGEVVDVQVADMNEMPLYHVRYVDPGEGASPYTPQAPTVHAFQAEQLQRAPLAAGESQRSSLFECKMRWHRRHAGRTMELPARGVCRSGDVLLSMRQSASRSQKSRQRQGSLPALSSRSHWCARRSRYPSRT